MHLLPLWGHSFKSVRSAASRYEKYVRTWENMGINSISWCQCKEMTHLPKRHQPINVWNLCRCLHWFHAFVFIHIYVYMYVCMYIYIYILWGFPKMGGTPKSSILIGCSIIDHLFLGSPMQTSIYIRHCQGHYRKGWLRILFMSFMFWRVPRVQNWLRDLISFEWKTAKRRFLGRQATCGLQPQVVVRFYIVATQRMGRL